jgi:hypothetical protein
MGSEQIDEKGLEEKGAADAALGLQNQGEARNLWRWVSERQGAFYRP